MKQAYIKKYNGDLTAFRGHHNLNEKPTREIVLCKKIQCRWWRYFSYTLFIEIVFLNYLWHVLWKADYILPEGRCFISMHQYHCHHNDGILVLFIKEKNTGQFINS